MASNRGNKSGSSKRSSGGRSSSDREMLEPRGSKRFARRDAQGQFTEQDEVGRSLRQDVKKHAKRTVQSGQGDRGDRKRS